MTGRRCARLVPLTTVLQFMIGFAAYREVEKKNDDRTKQIISLNIQQLPETDPLFNGYTGRVPIARANMLGRHSKYVFSVSMGK